MPKAAKFTGDIPFVDPNPKATKSPYSDYFSRHPEKVQKQAPKKGYQVEVKTKKLKPGWIEES